MNYNAICLSIGLCSTISMHAMQRGPMAWLVLLGVAARPVVFHEGHNDRMYQEERHAVRARQLQVRDTSDQYKRLDKVLTKRPKKPIGRRNQPFSKSGKRG